MPPVRSRAHKKPPPAGFEDIEDTLLEYANKMRDAQNASHEGKKKHEALWPIFQISHARSRYVYDLYYKREAISKQLYEWLIKNGYADGALIAKWKKQGYEKLCCLRCVQTKETNFQSTCICRVPKATLKKDGEAGEGGGGIQCQRLETLAYEGGIFNRSPIRATLTISDYVPVMGPVKMPEMMKRE